MKDSNQIAVLASVHMEVPTPPRGHYLIAGDVTIVGTDEVETEKAVNIIQSNFIWDETTGWALGCLNERAPKT